MAGEHVMVLQGETISKVQESKDLLGTEFWEFVNPRGEIIMSVSKSGEWCDAYGEKWDTGDYDPVTE